MFLEVNEKVATQVSYALNAPPSIAGSPGHSG